MCTKFSEEEYNRMLEKLFVRFPSFQKVGAGAYKPGIGNMEFFDQLAGHPHRQYRIIHIAGTNGKGSVSNMLTSALASQGLKVGLYTSPHILDFRERIRIVSCHPVSSCHPERSEGSLATLISKDYVWHFVSRWQETFDHLDMSFFEITTAMALCWFAEMKADVVVLETGLGGRLDSTNIVSPILSIITNIGLDHCDMLGETLPEIAFEKAGIIKPKVPVVIGESHPETDPVFERKVLYTNLPEPDFMGNRAAIMSLLTFVDKTTPTLWDEHEAILAEMDLQGEYQRKNLRTVLAALDVLASGSQLTPLAPSHSRAAGPSPYPGVGKCQLRSHPLPLEECTISSEGKTRGVLALGGGAVMTPSCAKLVHEHTLCIYLRASVETLLDHLSGEADKRPLLQNNTDQTTSDCHFDRAASDCHFDRAERVEKSPTLRQRIETLMTLRSSTYEKTAHIIIDTDGKSIDSICQEIISTAILPRP